MIKKLLFLSVATLVLAGCGKNEVTEDMLIGKWNCQNTVNKEMDFNGTSDELVDKPLEPDAKMEFVKEKGQVILNLLSSTDPVSAPFSIKGLELGKNKWIPFGDNNEIKNNTELTFISNDEYKMSTGLTIRYTTTKEKLDDIYGEVICKRIKD